MAIIAFAKATDRGEGGIYLPQAHKYTNTEAHKYTNKKAHKYTRTQIHKDTRKQQHKNTQIHVHTKTRSAYIDQLSENKYTQIRNLSQIITTL